MCLLWNNEQHTQMSKCNRKHKDAETGDVTKEQRTRRPGETWNETGRGHETSTRQHRDRNMTKTPQTSSLSQHRTNTGNDLPAEGSGDCVWYEHLSQHLHAEKRNRSVSYRAHRNPQNPTSDLCRVSSQQRSGSSCLRRWSGSVGFT